MKSGDAPPLVKSLSFTKVSETSSDRIFQGSILSDGGVNITESGVVYSKSNTKPTVSDSKTTTGSGNAPITATLVNLTPNETYYARAYAINSVGTSYGAVVSANT